MQELHGFSELTLLVEQRTNHVTRVRVRSIEVDGPAVVPERFVAEPQHRANIAEIRVRARIVRREAQHLLQTSLRLCRPILHREHHRGSIERIRVIGLAREHEVVVLGCLRQLPEIGERVRQVVPDFEVVGLGFQRHPIPRNRLRRPAQFAKRMPQIVVRIKVARIDRQRRTVVLHRLLDPSRLEQKQPAIVVRYVVASRHRDRAVEQRQ